jgi:hypothetical protein
VPLSSIDTVGLSSRAKALGFSQMIVIDDQPPGSCSIQTVPLQ